MAIILEGPDNCGKSTLATFLAEHLELIIVPSEGREKFPGEINERIIKYNNAYDNVIFDRHPVVSQPMYNHVVKNTPVDQSLMDDFYGSGHLFIYCRPPATDRVMEGHVAKEYDDPAYLAEVEAKYGPLVKQYDEWALTNAHLLYRIGDSTELLLNAIKGIIR